MPKRKRYDLACVETEQDGSLTLWVEDTHGVHHDEDEETLGVRLTREHVQRIMYGCIDALQRKAGRR